jgi:hypothetical protein
MKAYGGVAVQIHIFLTSTLVGGEWSASRPGHFIPGVRAPGTHWIGGLGGPQSRSGSRGEEKILDSTRTRTPDPSVVEPLASHYTNYAILAPKSRLKTLLNF